MADTADSKSAAGNRVGVQLPPSAPHCSSGRSIDELGVRSSTAPPWYPDLGWIATAPCWESFSVLSELTNNVSHRFPERTKIDPSRFLFPIRRPAPEWVPVTL